MFHAMLHRLALIVWIGPSIQSTCVPSARPPLSLSHAPLCDRSVHPYTNVQVSKLLRVLCKQWVPTPGVLPTNVREILDRTLRFEPGAPAFPFTRLTTWLNRTLLHSTHRLSLATVNLITAKRNARVSIERNFWYVNRQD